MEEGMRPQIIQISSIQDTFPVPYYCDSSSPLMKKTEENLPITLSNFYKSGNILHNSNINPLATMLLRRQHKCSYCNKTFHQSWLLKRHIRVHTGEKPFVCNMCKRSFNQLDTLKRHIRIHTGERPFVCKVCNKTYIDQRSLNTHYKTHAVNVHTT